MVQTSARLLKLLALLQSRGFWTGEALARELGVSERSVRRDVGRLRELGYPVHATAGVGGGYRLGAGKELPPLPLEDDEAIAVAIGLRANATGPVKGLEDASIRALVKLEQVLPRRLRRRVNALAAVSVRLSDPGPRIDAEVLAVVANACRDGERLRFRYEARRREAAERNVEPYRLVHSSHRWYLVAWDLDRAAWRTFRVDRITPQPRTAGRFQPRPLPSEDLAEWVSRAVSNVAYPHQARVTVHAPVEAVRNKLSWIGGRAEPIDADRCLVTAGADCLESLAFHLGLLQCDFEVREPPELAEHLQRLADRYARAAASAASAVSAASAAR